MATELMVTTPDPEASLLLYIAASDHAVSAVLVQEKEEGEKVIQRPVYFISEALLGAKLNYTEVEKIAYAVLSSSRKLKHYFQGHEITVPTSQPLGNILKNNEAFGRIGKWATELSQFEISYVPRIAIKSQALVDFMAEWTPLAQNNPQPSNQTWIIFTDGAWGQSGVGASAVIVALSGLQSKYAARLEFRATNNIAEYEGLILGLNKANALGAKTLLIKTDSSRSRASQKGIQGTRARADKISGNSKGIGTKVPRFHPETHPKVRNLGSR